MTPIAVLVPVLGRPARAEPLLQSLRATGHHRLVFLCSRGDQKEIDACIAAAVMDDQTDVVIVPFDHGPGDYARKINYGVEVTDEEWLFQAADDLEFHPGWDDTALRVAALSGKRVIGTNDLGNPRVKSGRHSTHSLVARSYILERGTSDELGKLLHEGYHHNFCDTEMIQTAMHRREFRFARRSVVEHLHPNWRKALDDRTYRLGMSRFDRDRRLYAQRRLLWRRDGGRAWRRQVAEPDVA